MKSSSKISALKESFAAEFRFLSLGYNVLLNNALDREVVSFPFPLWLSFFPILSKSELPDSSEFCSKNSTKPGCSTELASIPRVNSMLKGEKAYDSFLPETNSSYNLKAALLSCSILATSSLSKITSSTSGSSFPQEDRMMPMDVKRIKNFFICVAYCWGYSIGLRNITFLLLMA